MYAQKEKPKENKSRAVANSVGQKKSNVKQGFGFIDNRNNCSLNKIIQKNGKEPPTTDERTKSAVVGDRHTIPHPYIDLGGWYKSLMTGRIADLYLTAGGFIGHAQQVQQELDRLSPLIDEKQFRDPVSLDTAKTYEESIKKFIISEGQKVKFDFPKFTFSFSGGSTKAVKREGGIFTVS